MRLRNRSHYKLILRQLSLAAFLLACAKPSVSPTPSSVPHTPVKSVPSDSPSVNVPTFNIYRPGIIYYNYRALSVVKTRNDDSTHRTDSTQVTASLSATYSLLGGVNRVHASIGADSIKVLTLSDTVSERLLPNETHELDLDVTSGRSLPKHDLEPCSQIRTDRMFHGDEVTPTIRSNTQELQTWADTSVHITCRQGVTLTLSRVATYQRQSRNILSSPGLAAVIRTSNLTITGSGFQWQQEVRVSGHGQSVDTVLIHPIDARVASITGFAELELTFSSPLRIQQFSQTTNTKITIRIN